MMLVGAPRSCWRGLAEERAGEYSRRGLVEEKEKGVFVLGRRKRDSGDVK